MQRKATPTGLSPRGDISVSAADSLMIYMGFFCRRATTENRLLEQGGIESVPLKQLVEVSTVTLCELGRLRNIAAGQLEDAH